MSSNKHRTPKRTPRRSDGRNASLSIFLNIDDTTSVGAATSGEKSDRFVSVDSDTAPVTCPECRKSDNVIKRGVRKTKFRGDIQRYGCKACRIRFVNDPFAHTLFPHWVYEKVLDDSLEGINDVRIAKRVNKEAEARKENTKISPRSVHNIKKRTVEILREFELYAPRKEKAAVWEIDDTPQPHSGKKKNDQKENPKSPRSKKKNFDFWWVTNVLEEGDRYCLAQVSSTNRNASNSEAAIRLALLRAKYGPQLTKCDGYKGHVKGVRAVLRHGEIDSRTKKQCPQHINPIERYHQTIRSYSLKKRRRFRSIQNLDLTAELVRLYYDFLRPHESLRNLPPAITAGIDYPWNNQLTWVQLIWFAFRFLSARKRSI